MKGKIVGQIGHLVGDDDRAPRLHGADHLAQGAFGVVEVVEGADAQGAIIAQQRAGKERLGTQRYLHYSMPSLGSPRAQRAQQEKE